MKKQTIKTKKAQVITVSILVILFIFLLVLTLFFESLITRPFINDRTQVLSDEATRLSDSLLLSGYPENWHEIDRVQKIGLTTNNTLDIQKIIRLQQISEESYALSKIYLGIQNDYFINITYKEGSETTSIIIPPENDQLQEKKLVITRQRVGLIQIDDTEKTANIFIMIYS